MKALTATLLVVGACLVGALFSEGVSLLIQQARTNKNPAVRKQAMFWPGQSKDPRALKFFEEVLR